MAKMRTEKMDRAHRRPHDDGPQRGGIKSGSDAHQQQQQNPSREESGGIGRGELGQGGQRHPGGSSRDPRQQG